ncbi:hypothetical protein QL285_076836 [Trifolium repens]|nr:hypothetical protein QL285_076836 [Trifolium repens]
MILFAEGVIQQTLLLEYLKFDGKDLCEREGFSYIFSVLKSTLNLEELVIKNLKYAGYVRRQEPDQPGGVGMLYGCCLEQLRTMKIGIGSRFKHDSSLLRFILVLLSISRHLLRMKRTSQKVQVEFNTKFFIVSVLI